MFNYSGIITAVITPFKDFNVDYNALEKILHNQLENNIHGVVIAGSTGESSTLTEDEKLSMLKIAKNIIKNKIPIIMGIHANCPQEAIQQIQKYSLADSFLVCTPYYIKPTQEGIYEYYKMISLSTDRHIIAYNVPSRTSVEIDINTTQRILKLPQIIAIKDAVQDISRASLLKNSDKYLLSGDDASFLGYMLYGGSGVISVISNLLPKMMVELYNTWINSDYIKIHTYLQKISKINQSLNIETNPITIKYAMSQVYTYIHNELRIPLKPLDKEKGKVIQQELTGLIL